MAITVGVAPVAVPIAIPGGDRIVSARVHMVGSIDASERDLTLAGEVDPDDVGAVINGLQTLL